MRTIVLLYLTMFGVLVANERGLSVSLKGSFTTSTRFLYNIDRTNSYGEERTIDSNLGYGLDVRWNVIWQRFSVGFTVEKIAAHETIPVYFTQDVIPIPFNEGFQMTVMELNGTYVVPISNDQIRFYLGGGLGMYDGIRDFSIAGVKAATVKTVPYISIHVLTGIQYQLLSWMGFRFEIKFRDPHFDTTIKFDQDAAVYQGKRIPLPQGDSVTKINLFGVNYTGGLVFEL